MPIWSAIKTWLIVASGDALGGAHLDGEFVGPAELLQGAASVVGETCYRRTEPTGGAS